MKTLGNINSDPLPDRLYKYLCSEHMKRFQETGELRIGTLHGFRDSESRENDLGDAGEGIITRFDHVDYASGNQLSELARRFIKISGRAAETARFIDCEFERRETSPNYYIYCVSSSRSWSVGMKMKSDYDARIVIEEPLRFFEAIANCMAERIITPVYVVRCEYGSKRIDYRDKTVHPAKLKSSGYAYQREIRMVMEPTSSNIQAGLITCPAAIQFCSFETTPPEETRSRLLAPQFQRDANNERRTKRPKPAKNRRGR